jgi:hypothetical protein
MSTTRSTTERSRAGLFHLVASVSPEPKTPAPDGVCRGNLPAGANGGEWRDFDEAGPPAPAHA